MLKDAATQLRESGSETKLKVGGMILSLLADKAQLADVRDQLSRHQTELTDKRKEFVEVERGMQAELEARKKAAIANGMSEEAAATLECRQEMIGTKRGLLAAIKMLEVQVEFLSKQVGVLTESVTAAEPQLMIARDQLLKYHRSTVSDDVLQVFRTLQEKRQEDQALLREREKNIEEMIAASKRELEEAQDTRLTMTATMARETENIIRQVAMDEAADAITQAEENAEPNGPVNVNANVDE